MNKKEMFFIRACKSKNPTKRLKTLHRRFYISLNEEQTKKSLIGILSNICNDYKLSDIVDFIGKILKKADDNRYFDINVSIQELILETLISKIRFSETSKFPELIPPARFEIRHS